MKTVAILSDNPDLESICKQIDAVREKYLERLKFIKKQAEDAAKSGRDEEKPLMDALRAKIRERGKLPDDRLMVDYDLKGDSVTVGEPGNSSLAAFLAHMLGGGGGQ